MPQTFTAKHLVCAALMAALDLPPAYAADAASDACPPPNPARAPRPTVPRELPENGAQPVYIYSDQVKSAPDEPTVFTGNVELRRGALHVDAEELTYDQTQEQVSARGNVVLRNDAGDTLKTPALDYRLDTETGVTGAATFSLPNQNNARGDAKRVTFLGPDQMRLDRTRYTACPPGRDDWYLKGRRIDLDKEAGVGSARDVTLAFLHVPIFYSPYFTFPLSSERKSGFLIPQLGYGNKTGTLLATPYYLNLAPNYDATLTPRLMSKRGLLLGTEFRYLGESYYGQLDAEYTSRDSLTDTDRGSAVFRHHHRLSPYWTATADLRWVSDENYFVDLADTTDAAAQTHLPRRTELNYGGRIWRFSARTFSYQTLDPAIPPASRPYERLPQLRLSADFPSAANRLHYSLDSEWTYFDRSEALSGQRFDVRPSVSLPLRNAFAFFIPKAGVQYTGYNLTNVAAAADETPTRSLPIYSLDSGLLFERDAAWNGRSYIQTLEPRVFYAYIPYKDQDRLPVFDAGVPDFSFYNLFRENRFVGGDRIGDTNQATVALTSRFLDGTNGTELARISVGEVFFFEDQLVNLPAGTTTQDSSDLVAEVQARLGSSWYLRSGVQWDGDENRNRKGSALVQYRPAADRILNIGYRYVRTTQDQADISAQWPLTRRWTALARWNYSFLDRRTLQAYSGIQYTSCCWVVRLLGRHRLLADGTEDNSVLFQLELSGLGKLGQTEESPLRQGQFIFD